MPSILNRISKDSFFGGKFSQVGSQSRKSRSTASVAPADEEADENLNLFSKNRQSFTLSSNQSAASEPLRRLSLMSGKVMRSGLDDLISSAEKEKHDYDWLLTPPGTPLDPSSDAHEPQATHAPSKRIVLARSQSASTSNASSRLSGFQTEINPPSRLARSSSVTRSLSTASQFSTHSTIMSSSVLNTSSASVASYIRPSSPTRHSFSSVRSTSSNSATPSRASIIPRCASSDRARPSRNPVSSAPSPRIQIPASSNTRLSTSRANSQPSTPTRRVSSMYPASLSSSNSLTARPSSHRGSAASRSCPSSPGPRPRPSTPIDLHDAPPNLRTSLPNRALSTGRTRPGLPSVRTNSEKISSHDAHSRQSRSSDSGGRGSLSCNEQGNIPVTRRIPSTRESTTRKPVTGKSSPNVVPENNEFRRSISTKSMDTSVRHTDNKVSSGRVHPVSGVTLYPHSTRPAATSKSQLPQTSTPLNSNRTKLVGNRWTSSEIGNHSRSTSLLSSEFQEPDIFESYRFDSSLLEEDMKSTNWLCSSDDSGGLMFDNGLDLLPEPFGPL